MGKGDNPRPPAVPRATVHANHDRIFGPPPVHPCPKCGSKSVRQHKDGDAWMLHCSRCRHLIAKRDRP